MDGGPGRPRQEHERFFRQGVDADPLVRGQGMGGGEHRDETLGQHVLGHQAFFAGRVAEQPDVDGVLLQRRDLRRGRHLAQLELHLGEPLAVGAQHPRQDGRRQRGGETDAQASRLTAADPAGRVQAVGHLVECALGGRKEFPAGGGKRDRAGTPLEQRMSDLVLQPADLLAQRRLGDPQALRGPAEMQLLGENGERAQLVEADFRAIHTLTDITLP